MHSGTLIFPAIERIVFGQPAASALAAEAARLDAQRVFLMASATLNRTTDEVAKVRAALGTRCAVVFDRMPTFTPRDAVLEAAQEARAANADLVVTFGGGSVTDAGKMVRLCLRNNVTHVDGFDVFRTVTRPDGTRHNPVFEGPEVHQIAMPTTLSGGDYNAQAGCSDTRHKVKHAFRHPRLMPRVTILDPAPTVHAPLWVWLSTGVRGIDHAAEGLCSQFTNPAGDASFLQALRLFSTALPRVKKDPGDLEARLDCQFAVWLSMAGRLGSAQMGVCHAIGHTLGGSYEVPQGYASCILLPHVMRYNRSVNADRQRLVAEAMGHPGEDAADVIATFVAGLGMPGRLSDVGIRREQFDAIAAHTMHDSWLHMNPRKITAVGEVREILEAAA